MTPPAGEVLVVGGAGVGKRCLLSRLLNIKEASSGQPLQQQQPWGLDTKYYRAQVLVERQLPTAKANPAAATCGGLVLVFAADQDSSFLAVKQWVEQLPSDVADVRLCVANKVDKLQNPRSSQQESAVQRTPMLQEAMQWCADSLFEYIEVSSTDVELDQQLVWEEQQQGVRRVKEALEAHMWPGLKMKPKQTQHGQHALPANHAGCETTQPEQSVADLGSASDADTGDFKAFQNAEEAEFDQLDKMFEELRSKLLCQTCIDMVMVLVDRCQNCCSVLKEC